MIEKERKEIEAKKTLNTLYQRTLSEVYDGENIEAVPLFEEWCSELTLLLNSLEDSFLKVLGRDFNIDESIALEELKYQRFFFLFLAALSNEKTKLGVDYYSENMKYGYTFSDSLAGILLSLNVNKIEAENKVLDQLRALLENKFYPDLNKLRWKINTWKANAMDGKFNQNATELSESEQPLKDGYLVYKAIDDGDATKFNELIANGYPLDYKDKETQLSSLHLASGTSSYFTKALIISGQCNYLAKDAWGRIPYQVALQCDLEETALALLTQVTSQQTRTDHGLSIAMYIKQHGTPVSCEI